jgi:hypothetical protein
MFLSVSANGTRESMAEVGSMRVGRIIERVFSFRAWAFEGKRDSESDTRS